MVTSEHLIPISFPHLGVTEPFISIPMSKLSGTLKHSLMCFPITQDHDALIHPELGPLFIPVTNTLMERLWVSQGTTQGSPFMFPWVSLNYEGDENLEPGTWNPELWDGQSTAILCHAYFYDPYLIERDI